MSIGDHHVSRRRADIKGIVLTARAGVLNEQVVTRELNAGVIVECEEARRENRAC